MSNASDFRGDEFGTFKITVLFESSHSFSREDARDL